MKNILIRNLSLLVLLVASALSLTCSRFNNRANDTVNTDRVIVISPIYNEIIFALGAQDKIVGVDLSSTYPPEIKNVQTVGYHRALSAEGILSLHPTVILSDSNSMGPPQVVEQIQQLNIPIKSFDSKNDSIDGTKALIREIAAFFHKEDKAEELCRNLDQQLAAATEAVKQYNDHPRVAIIHFGRASNVYMVVGKTGGEGGGAGKMIEMAGGTMALDAAGMQRMASPEIIAQANPDVILVTNYGYDQAGGTPDAIKQLPGVATSNAAKNNKIYRIEENELMYFGPRTGDNLLKVAKVIHQ
ncbi:MAG TPA: ABC transporter substrate-binding protein [Pyrinomonadaceae bacterium]|jgi:iron complex transport system substrate-binding protein|nr:ABC transporter substrate-binding protein [Pyrinomonadaceae bacterium]